MQLRTHVKAEVPIDRAGEAIGYFGQLLPGCNLAGTHRLGTDVAWLEVVLPGDAQAKMEAALERVDTHGIPFTVHITPY